MNCNASAVSSSDAGAQIYTELSKQSRGWRQARAEVEEEAFGMRWYFTAIQRAPFSINAFSAENV